MPSVVICFLFHTRQQSMHTYQSDTDGLDACLHCRPRSPQRGFGTETVPMCLWRHHRLPGRIANYRHIYWPSLRCGGLTVVSRALVAGASHRQRDRNSGLSAPAASYRCQLRRSVSCRSRVGPTNTDRRPKPPGIHGYLPVSRPAAWPTSAVRVRRSGPVRVGAGDAPFPAQTLRNPQETNGMSGAPRLANRLQIDGFSGPGALD